MKPKFKYSREMYSPRVNIKFLETDEFGNQIYEYSVNGKTFRYSIPDITKIQVPLTSLVSTYSTNTSTTITTSSYAYMMPTTMTTNTYTL